MHATFENPTLRMQCKSGQSQVEVQSSLQLALPHGLEGMQSIEELLRMTSSGELWVARTRSCSLTVEVTTLGSCLSKAETALVQEWISGHRLWSQYGIHLVSPDADAVYASNQINLSIQHPDLSSALVAPEKALVAEFHSARCTVDLSVMKTPSLTSAVADTSSSDRLEGSASNTQSHSGHCTDCIDAEDQRAALEFVTRFHQCEDQDPTPRRSKRRRIHRTQRCIENIGLFKNAIDTAIRVALLGAGNTGNDYRLLEQMVAPGLTQLAPGVFNLPYTKAVVGRASLCTILGSSLTRMTKAESPSLRHKMAQFKTLPTSKANVPPDLDLAQNIENNIWKIMLRYSTAPSNRKKKPNQSPEELEGSRQSFHDSESSSVSHAPFSSVERRAPRVLELYDDNIQFDELDEAMLPDFWGHPGAIQESGPNSPIQSPYTRDGQSQTLWYEDVALPESRLFPVDF